MADRQSTQDTCSFENARELLSCQNISFAYEGNVVLSGVDFTVNAGDYVCIIGENGAGKSTLMKGLLGLKKPCSGTIRFSPSLKTTEIGYLPQQTATQKDFPASVWEIVLSGRLNSLGLRPFYRRKDKLDASDKLQLLGIDHLRSRCYRNLSGGQQQRVLLARALCATSRLLLLDEPSTGLDPTMKAELYRLIAKLNKEYGITILMVTHDIKGAIRYSNQILQLGKKQLFYGKTEEYLHTEIGKKFMQTGGESA